MRQALARRRPDWKWRRPIVPGHSRLPSSHQRMRHLIGAARRAAFSIRRIWTACSSGRPANHPGSTDRARAHRGRARALIGRSLLPCQLVLSLQRYSARSCCTEPNRDRKISVALSTRACTRRTCRDGACRSRPVGGGQLLSWAFQPVYSGHRAGRGPKASTVTSGGGLGSFLMRIKPCRSPGSHARCLPPQGFRLPGHRTRALNASPTRQGRLSAITMAGHSSM